MRTALSGPVIIVGNDNPQQISDTETGPNFDYQSNALIDSRFASLATAAGNGAQGGILGWHNTVELETLSAVPQPLSNTAITSSQTPAAGAFFALNATYALGSTPNMPLIPQGAPQSTNAQFSQPNAANQNAFAPGSTNLVTVLALDFGFANVTTVAGSPVVTVTGPLPSNYTGTAAYATRFFYPGQKVIVAQGGNVGGTAPIFATVLATDRYSSPGVALAAAGTILLSTNMLFSGTNVAVGTSDQEYGVTMSPVIKAGAGRVYDPAQLVSRCVTVTNGVGGSGFVTVRGYDIYGQPMSNQIAITASSTVTGTKAFKYISSVQVNAGGVTTGGVSIGTSNTIGLPERADEFEYNTIFVNQLEITVSTNFTFADQTTPATPTTGDPRGTYAMVTAASNTNRVTIFQIAPAAQAMRATNIDCRGIVGVPQA